MLVAEVMTANVVTVDVDRTVADAAGRMLEFGIGSVVVSRDGDPVGILTETDVVTAGYDSGRPLGAIPIEAAMSHPLVTVAPETTVRAAVERMREAHVKKLPVVDGIDLVGILTQEDVVFAHPKLLREAIHHEERRADWEEPEDGQ